MGDWFREHYTDGNYQAFVDNYHKQLHDNFSKCTNERLIQMMENADIENQNKERQTAAEETKEDVVKLAANATTDRDSQSSCCRPRAASSKTK